MFRGERACFQFVVDSRWPDGFRCPKCGHASAYERSESLLLECAKCRTLVSATAGTVMHGTRLPLDSWLLAAWLLVTDKRGISAKYLERTLGVSYETAYQMLHRLRAAMVNPDRERLDGRIEVDETLVGGVKHGRTGKGTAGGEGGKFIVLGALEVRRGIDSRSRKPASGPVRLRLRHAPDLRGTTLVGFVRDLVQPGAMVVTDGLKEYGGVRALGYRHEIEMFTFNRPQKEVLKHLHLAFSNLKTWLGGTFHGRVEGKHLQVYLDEYVFRFNRRRNLPAAFQTVLGLVPKVAASSYAAVYSGNPTHRGSSRLGPAQVVGRP